MSTKFDCAICQIIAHGERDWESHITGKKHQANLYKVHAAQEQYKRRQAAEEKQSKTCTICWIELPDAYQYECHVKGKKHVANAERIKMKTECGVYVGGIPMQARPEDLRYFFSTFGELVEFIQIPGRNFVLLQYQDRQSAINLMTQPIFLGGRRLTTQPRRPPSTPPPKPQPPPPPGVDVDYKEVKRLLTSGGDLQALVKELEVDPSSDRKFAQLCRDLETVFRPLFPHVKAWSFGSTVTGLALKGSDIDVFLNVGQPVPNAAPVASTAQPPEELVVSGRKILRRFRHIFSHVIAVTKAKIPIIKFIHCPTKISCDVSFKNSRGIWNSQLIRFFISLDPRIRPYLLIIKYWAKVHELAGQGRMSNYALVTLSLFYLQQLEKPLVPCVAKLQSSFTDSDLDDGWLCKFNKDASHVQPAENKDSVFELLYGFFHYLAEFDFGGNVICPLTGKPIQKSSFAQPDTLPSELHLYKKGIPDRALKFSADMCVQDPFDLSHNLTGRMVANTLSTFCAYCVTAKEILADIIKEKEESKRLPGLVKLFDVNIKPKSRKFILSSAKMVTNVSVAQYLSLGLMLDGEVDSADVSDDCTLKKLKIYKWYSLVFDLLLDVFQKVMKFTVNEEGGESLSKVQKVGEPSDVHINASNSSDEIGFSIRTISCTGCYNLWEGRKKYKKTLKIEQELHVMKVEEAISNVIMETLYSNNKKTTAPIVKFTCIFEPNIDPVSVTLVFHNKGSVDGSFLCVMNLLQARIPVWIERSMAYLMKVHLKPSSSEPASDVQTTPVEVADISA